MVFFGAVPDERDFAIRIAEKGYYPKRAEYLLPIWEWITSEEALLCRKEVSVKSDGG